MFVIQEMPSTSKPIWRAAIASGCLAKPLQADELDTQLGAIRAGIGIGWEGLMGMVDEEAVARAKARYSLQADLVEAALELARGLPKDE